VKSLQTEVEAKLMKIIDENQCDHVDEEFYVGELKKLKKEFLDKKKIERHEKKYSVEGMIPFEWIRSIGGYPTFQFTVLR